MMARRLPRMGFLRSEIASVHAAALILGAAGLVSRILGMVRDLLLAAHFGAGRELDIYNAAFNIPDFMATLFLLGGAAAAILPLFQEYALRDKKKAQQLISLLSTIFLIGAGIAAIAAFFAAPFAMRFIVPGFSPADQARTLALTRLMLMSPILLGLSGIFSVVVQSSQRFLIFALAPILYNIGIIFGITALAPRFGIAGVAAGVVIGALLHAGLQAWSALSLGFAPRFFQTLSALPDQAAFAGVWRDVIRVMTVALPRVVAVSLSQLTLLALDAVASTFAAGSVAVLGFAQNLYFVPIGIFGVSYATAIFPRLAASSAARSGDDFFRELSAGIRSILFWTAPSVALTIVLRAHIVRLALGAGAFSWDNTRATAAVLAALAIGMAAGSLQTLLIRGFYALGNTWIPLAVNAGASLFSLALAVFFAHALAARGVMGQTLLALFRIADLPHPEVTGLGLGFALGLLCDVSILSVLLVVCVRKKFGSGRMSGGREILKVFGAAAGAGIAAYAVRASFSGALPLVTFVRVMIQTAASAGAGFIVYFGLLTLLGHEDVILLRRALTRRLFSLRILPLSWDGDEIK